VNLAYTTSLAVDGVCRANVDVGRRAATFQPDPSVAEDLTKMQVSASVSESDIGRCGGQSVVLGRRYPATTFADASSSPHARSRCRTS